MLRGEEFLQMFGFTALVANCHRSLGIDSRWQAHGRIWNAMRRQ